MDLQALYALLQDDKFWLCVTSFLSACSALAALTPSPKDDGVLAKLRGLLDLLAFNFRHAKNEDKTEK